VHASSAGEQSKALAFFDELAALADDSNPSEGSLVGMISGCVEAHNAVLAEYIFKWAHKEGRCTTAIFSATLKVLAASKRNDQICALYQLFSNSKRLALDDGVRGQIIDAAEQAGRVDLVQKLSRPTESDTQRPDAQSYMTLMRACGQEGNVDKALQLLRELQDYGEVDTVTYNCVLDVCVSCGSGSAAKTIFQEMKSSGRTDVVSYNIMLKQCTSDQGSSSAVDEVLEEMRKGGLKPTTSTYNYLIGAALTGSDFAKAWSIIDRMEVAGQHVDAYTLTILLKGYRQERRTIDSSTVGRVLALVKAHSVKVDEVLVNVALEACLALRDMTRLKDALQTFARSGWTIQKHCSMHTYGVLIKAHGQTQNLEEAWRLWQEATVEKGMEASEQLYGQMIDVLVGSNCLDDALQLFEDMKVTHKDSLNSQGFSVAYAMIIRGFAQRKDCVRALQCYEDMKLHGTKVSLVVLNTLIDACSRVGDMVTATKIFKDMSESQCVPDVITYSTLIKGHCGNDDLDRALQLFSAMQKSGIRPDAILFNSLLDGCAKKQLPALCEQVIHDMENAGVVPSNHSASILIKLYGRCKDLDAAFRVINDMPKKYGFKPNNAVYTCLMSACIGNGRFDQAMDLRLRMLQEGVYPDEKTYSTLLRGALRAASVEQCVLLVNSALDQNGVRSVRHLLDDELVKSVLILIQRRNMWEAHGQELLERLQSRGMSVRCPEVPKSHSNHGSSDQFHAQRNNNNNGKNNTRNFNSARYSGREVNAANDAKALNRWCTSRP
jgi:pentatricopeptide repeat protein